MFDARQAVLIPQAIIGLFGGGSMPAGRRLFESLTILLLSAVGLFLQAVPLWASVLLSSTLVAWTVASWQSLEKVLAKSYPRRMVGRVISIFGIIAGTSFAAGSLVTRGLESAVHQDRIGWLVTFLGCALLCVPIAIFARTKRHMTNR